MIKFFTETIWETQSLLISATRTVDTLCEQRSCSQTPELYEELRELQEFRHKSGVETDETHPPDNGPRNIDAVLSSSSIQQYENLLRCKDEILRFIDQSRELFTGQNGGRIIQISASHMTQLSMLES